MKSLVTQSHAILEMFLKKNLYHEQKNNIMSPNYPKFYQVQKHHFSFNETCILQIILYLYLQNADAVILQLVLMMLKEIQMSYFWAKLMFVYCSTVQTLWKYLAISLNNIIQQLYVLCWPV